MCAAAAYWRFRPPVRVITGPVRKVRAFEETLERTLRVTGQLAASRSATFVAPAMRGSRTRSFSSGDFRLILLEARPPGARVRAGEVVARFDPQYMLTRVDDQRADVEERKMINRRIDASIDVRRNQLQQRIRLAEADVEKAKLNVKTIPVRSAIVAEQFRLAEEEATARLRQVLVELDFFDQIERSQLRREELALRDVTLDLHKAEANVDKMTYRSPINGVVVMGRTQRGSDQADIEAGDEVRPGHAFMQVMDTDSLYLDAIANQADEALLHTGAKAVIRLDAMNGVEIPGRVHSIGALATANRYRPDWVRHFAVRIYPDHPDPRAFPNLTGSADIVTASEHGITLPRECVQIRAGFASVELAVPGADGEVSRETRNIELGLTNNIRVVVRSGIQAGDTVACP